MKKIFLIILFATTLLFPTAHAELQAIKEKNLAHADMALMNNHDPQAELESFTLMDGYEVNLFASTPMLANPIHMTWDAQGRLWVVCSWAYPQIKPGELPDDKIYVIEDTDGDGVADKSTLFADKLYIPTGIEVADGGVYVAQTPDILFLKDTDGDGKADLRRVELTGFGIEDSHHAISAWRRGPAGWIYFQEGVFLNTQVETSKGVVRLSNGGIFQYRPRTQDLRIFTRAGGGNPWGHMIDRWGQHFQVNNPRIAYISPVTGNSLEKARMPILASTEKQCGGDLVESEHLSGLNGQMMTGRFKSGAIIRYEFGDDGAGFTANVKEPLISSKHPCFRPVDCKVGPDGALYIADWYNPIINHAQHDFRDPRRLVHQGRIWRVTAKDKPLVERPKIVGQPISKLLDHLKSPNHWTRHYSRLELSDRDADAVANAIPGWVDSLDAKDADYDHHALEALWALQNVNRVNESILKKVLTAKTPEARAAGARTLRYWHGDINDPVAFLSLLAADPHPRVRMEAILSAGFIPDAEVLPIVLRMALDLESDEFIELALKQTLSALQPHLADAQALAKLKFGNDKHRDYAMALGGQDMSAQLNRVIRDGGKSQNHREFLQRIGVSGSDKYAGLMIKSLRSNKKLSIPFTLDLLKTLTAIKRNGASSPAIEIEELSFFLTHEDEGVVRAAMALMGEWKVRSLFSNLTDIITDQSLAMNVREEAAITAGKMQGKKAPGKLKEFLAEDQPMPLQYLGALGAASGDVKRSASLVADVLMRDPGEADPSKLISSIILSKGGADALAAALSKKTPHPKVAERVSSHFRTTGQLPEKLSQYFKSSTLSLLDSLLKAEDRQALADESMTQGDPARGQHIYRRPALACASCHAIGGAGAVIGPDLGALGAAAEPLYMVNSILEPNMGIAEHYQTVTVTTRDGNMRFGILGYQDNEAIFVKDSGLGGKEVRIARKDIQSLVEMPSLMPSGLANQLKNRQEFLDLVAFLSNLGKGEYATSVRPIIRHWKIIKAESFKRANRMDDASWLTLSSLVDGELPAVDFSGDKFALLRAYVDVREAGKLKLAINNRDGLKVWVGRQLLKEGAPVFEVAKGRVAITFQIDIRKRGDTGLKVELLENETEPAKFSIVSK